MSFILNQHHFKLWVVNHTSAPWCKKKLELCFAMFPCQQSNRLLGANASLISSYHHPGKDRAHTLCEFTTPYQCVHPPHSKPWQHAPPLARCTKAAIRTQTSSYLQLFIGAYVCKAPTQWLQKPHSESIQQSKHQVPHYWQTRQISFEKEYKQSSMPSPIPN